MKATIVVDTGVIVEYLKTGKGVLPKVYEDYTMHIPASALTELLASETFKDSSLEKEVVEFVDKYFEVKDIDRKTADEAARIIRENSTTMAVALVAATAVIEKLKLLTTDKATFQGISGVELLEVE